MGDNLADNIAPGERPPNLDELLEESELSLLETLNHVLDRGLVIAGEVTISVADVDLIFVGLNVLLGSVETIDQVLSKRQQITEHPEPVTGNE